jgi:hypothetical protein
LVSTKKSTINQLVFQVVILVFTLSDSTAIIERTFSVINIIKIRLRNKIEDVFLTDSLMLYIEREIDVKFSTYLIIDDFRDLKERQFPF